jgi:chaperonin cofactor prefoldin
MATPQDKIIEALEIEIIKLKTQLSDIEEKYQKMRKKFDALMIKIHGGGRK